jgi:hypothetical protein
VTFVGEHSHHARSIARGVIDPQRLPSCLTITGSSISGTSKRWTIQASYADYWLIYVRVSDTQYGAPSATGNTVAFTTGTVWQTITADAAYEVLSDANGTVVLTVDVASATTRYVSAAARGPLLDVSMSYSSGSVTWDHDEDPWWYWG